MPSYQHCGLFFMADQIEHAQQNRARPPFDKAWALLAQEQADGLAQAQWDGLRWRFQADANAGERAAIELQRGASFEADGFWQGLRDAITAAQTFEMVRDHPTMSDDGRKLWINQFSASVNNLNQPAYELAHYEQLWLGVLNISAGVVLESDAWFARGVTVYEETIRDAIRPEGYLPLAVDAGDGRGFYRQLLSVGALVLMAEAAGHVGVDLWGYASRGVSVITAAAYLTYYYYYPDKWRWDTGVEADSESLFRTHGGFMEMLNRHAQPKDAKLMLDTLRPLYDPAGGGLTTLTHGVAPRRGLFG